MTLGVRAGFPLQSFARRKRAKGFSLQSLTQNLAMSKKTELRFALYYMTNHCAKGLIHQQGHLLFFT